MPPEPSFPPSPEPLAEPNPIDRVVRSGLEVEQRLRDANAAELERRTRELRYREAVDQRLLRLGIGGAVFLLATAWLVADVILTLAVGWGELNGRPFRLESGVIIAFLTTSTATVIGLFLVFLRWLYPQGPVIPGGSADRAPEGRGR
ncbi:hypothetical protein DAERI_170003 [Deinococcus aerius]|uniref:Uncharacterized protein n=1 Tax=Deinococcus aerius TaxID=200253 RepID=A0A2I9CZR6_9DEIO|nr:hypothetical protein [Deinococcus aerius]GBF07744.1 hypothetical protein DAERI_170003 [Deinococcus aerius]